MMEYDSRSVSLLAMMGVLFSVFGIERMTITHTGIFRDFALFTFSILLLCAIGILIPTFQIKPDK